MAKKSSTKKKLRVAFIGAGGIAGQHMSCLKDYDDVEVVAISDVAAPSLKRWTEQYGIENTFTDWKQMLSKVDIDAVDICTPNFLHYQPAIDALNAGCHVFVEKPLAMNAKEGQEMVDLAKKKKLACTIAFQWRFHPKTQAIKQAREQGVLGDILYSRVHAMRRRGIPNWGVFGRKELQGGGPMIDIGVHVMEMTHYAMGLPKPVSASGRYWTYMGDKKSKTASSWPHWDHKTYTVEDLAVGLVKFDNGAVMHVEAMFAGHIAPEDEGMKFEVFGTKGGAHSDPLRFFYDSHGLMLNAQPQFLPKDGMWQVKMRNFVDVCLYGKEDKSPAEHGLMIQKMIDAIYKSSETGKEVIIK